MDPDALVIRFRPTEAESVLGWARKEYRRLEHYGLSVFADVKREGESAEDLRSRLLAVSELSGIDPDKNKKYYACSDARELLERGFVFVKDEEPGERPEHFCVLLPGEPDVSTVERFLEPFGPAELR